MMPIILAIFISFLFYSFSEQKKREEKEILLTKAEKNFLVSQINPHFLFNILNNIYTLSLTNDNKSSKAIMQLSKMLDYSLYGSKKKTVSLKEEIHYILNLIELFKLKDDAIEAINFDYSKVNQSYMIAPMLLIPFVENTFKHGNIEDTKNGFIDILLTTEANNITFKVKNSYKPKKSVDASSGIGILNVKRRLELIYPNKHELEINKQKEFYNVNLIIRLENEL
ncbi:sensor histidine kinase [Aquimarina sp. Aq78]|uniref:sensor histidine kinase n=1 Tax=Aquimarina sp. Aq78 TaxID=1191889 RepID=UPI00131E1459|nr:histidine kinase [Aquimarina sp. Aq78]